MPLAQNRQPTGQPTCELTQAVRRSASGIITVSAAELLQAASLPFRTGCQVSRSFSVPSVLLWRAVTVAAAEINSLGQDCWSRCERLVIA